MRPVAVRRGQPVKDALRVRVCYRDDEDGSFRHGGAQVHASLRALKSDSREGATEPSQLLFFIQRHTLLHVQDSYYL